MTALKRAAMQARAAWRAGTGTFDAYQRALTALVNAEELQPEFWRELDRSVIVDALRRA